MITASGLLAFVLLVLTTFGVGTASAHAVLESTDPPDGAVLPHAPQRVLLRFGEPVTVLPNAVKVYDNGLRPVQAGQSGHLNGRADTIGVRLRPNLSAGTYTVTYRVISADSHPVSGGFRFSIGHPGPASSTVPTATQPGGAAGPLMAASRWLGYAGAVLGLGGMIVLLLLWSPGRRDRRARVVGWVGWALLTLGALGQLLFQGPYAAGQPLDQLARPVLLLDTISTRFGQVMLARLGLLVLLAGWLHDVFDRRSVSNRRLSAGCGAVLGVAVLLTMSASGHAATGDLVPLSVASDLVHLVAMTLWLGGLALLAACLLARQHAAELAAALPGFSRLATVCVAALVVTGGYQAWRDVRYLPAFVDTTYGLLLVAKMATFLVLIALGNLARRWVHRHYRTRAGGVFGPRLTAEASGTMLTTTMGGEPATGAVRALRRGLAAEAVIGAVVLGLTAVLVGTAQAKEAYTPTYRTQVVTSTQRMQVVADPAHVGPTTLTVRLRGGTGAPVTAERVSGSLTLPQRHVGPLPVTFHVGPHGASAHTQFPAEGSWLLNISVQTSPTSATTYQVRIPVV